MTSKAKRRTYAWYRRFEVVAEKYRSVFNNEYITVMFLKALYDELNRHHAFGYRHVAWSAWESLNLVIEDNFPKYVVAETL